MRRSSAKIFLAVFKRYVSQMVRNYRCKSVIGGAMTRGRAFVALLMVVLVVCGSSTTGPKEALRYISIGLEAQDQGRFEDAINVSR